MEHIHGVLQSNHVISIEYIHTYIFRKLHKSAERKIVARAVLFY